MTSKENSNWQGQSKNSILELKPFPENWLTTEEAINQCWFEYTYDTDTDIYNIKCCNEEVNIDTYFWVTTVVKCKKCNKSFTRQALLSDACFVRISEPTK